MEGDWAVPSCIQVGLNLSLSLERFYGVLSRLIQHPEVVNSHPDPNVGQMFTSLFIDEIIRHLLLILRFSLRRN